MPSTLVVVAGPPLPGRWALARAIARRLGARLLHSNGYEDLPSSLRGGESVVIHGDLISPTLRAQALAPTADERVLVEWMCSSAEAQREICHRWVRRPPSLVERELTRYQEWAAHRTPIDDGEAPVVVRVGAKAPLSDQVLRVISALQPRLEELPPSPRRPTVLVVEDEMEQRLLLGEVLSEMGCLVEVAPDAAVALALLEADPFDLVLSDQRMPGMTGTELAAEVTRRHPRTRVVLLTAHADHDTVDRAMGARARNVLTKPVSVVDLQRVLDDVM
jgi:CheY-like chemotaxis protein/predicted kinase